MDGNGNIRMPWGSPLALGVMARLLEVAYEIKRSGRFYGNPAEVVDGGARYGFKVEAGIFYIFASPSEEARRDLDMKIRITKEKISEAEQAVPVAIKDFPSSEQEVLIKRRDDAKEKVQELKWRLGGLEMAERKLREPYTWMIDLQPLLEGHPVALVPCYPEKPEAVKTEAIAGAEGSWQLTSSSTEQAETASSAIILSEPPPDKSESEGLPISVASLSRPARKRRGRPSKKGSVN